MNFLNGTDYLLLIDLATPLTNSRGTDANYRLIACGTGQGFNMDIEGISLRNKCDNGYDYSASGYLSWGMDLDGFAVGLKNNEKILKANFNEMAQLAKDKRTFWLKWQDTNTSVTREGKVRISSYRETANLENPYSFTVNFVGIGEPFLSEDIFKKVITPDNTLKRIVQDGTSKLIQAK